MRQRPAGKKSMKREEVSLGMCQKKRPHDKVGRRITYGYDLSCRRLLLGAPEVF